MASTITCPYCGKLADAKLDQCPHCGGKTHQADLRRAAGGAAGAGHHCPSCGAGVSDGDIICVQCGTNLLTGQKIVAEQAQTRPAREPWPYWRQTGIGLGVVLIVALLVAIALFWAGGDPLADARRLNREGNVLEAINVLQRHVDQRPDHAEARLLLGKLFWRNQQYSNAAEAFEAAAQANPADLDAAMWALAAMGRLGGETATARQVGLLRRVVDHHPDDTRARYLLALALGSQGDAQGQIEQLERVLAARPEDPKARQQIAAAHALRGDHAAARENLEAARRAGAPGAEVAATAGLVAALEGAFDASATELAAAITQGTAVQGLARVRLGALHMAEGRFDEALPHLREARNLPDAPPAARFFHALAMQANGLETEAAAEYERIIAERGPFAGEAALQSALIYLAQDNRDRAQDALTQAQSLDAAGARFHTIQGQLFALQGEDSQAQQAFRRAVQADPQYPAARLESGLFAVNRGLVSEGLRELDAYLALLDEGQRDPRAREVELLVNQLRQTTEGDGAVARSS